MSGDKDFLSRWSARKQEARTAGDAPRPDEETPPTAEPAVSPEELESLSDAELCQRLGLPDPETLQEGDDFKAFLDSRVPERLKRIALRRLWRSNPLFNIRDGLDDYDEDYRAIHASTDAVKTLYRVGEGFMKQLPGDAEANATNEAADDDATSPIEKNVAMRDICAPECDSDAPENMASQCGEDVEPLNSEADADETGCGGRSRITSRRMSFRFVEKPNKRA